MPNFSSQAVPDLSAMMFPSADPWAYPNQPMTTLENGQFIKQENPMDHTMYGLASTTSSSYENLNTQIFGGMSPFLMQGQPPGFSMQNLTPPMGMGNADSGANTMSMHGNDWPQQQQQQSEGTLDVNLDHLFGEDWGGWMHQGCRR